VALQDRILQEDYPNGYAPICLDSLTSIYK
jgi:hypothetical protein